MRSSGGKLGSLAVRIGALLRLQHETITFIAIQTAKASCAVSIVLKHPAFKNIIVVGVIGLSALGWIDANVGA